MIPDIAELRALLPYMTPANRQEIMDDLFGERGKGDGLDGFTDAELDRLEFLLRKIGTAFPHCGGEVRRLTLRELFDSLPDDELREFLELYGRAGM
jgi:hypothetical protein